MIRRLLLAVAGTLLDTALLGSCSNSVGTGNGGGHGTGNGPATALVSISGDSQVAIIDDTLPLPLRIRAVNERGAGVAGSQSSGRPQPTAWFSHIPAIPTLRARPQ